LVWGYIHLTKGIITPIIENVNYGGRYMIVFDKLWIYLKNRGISTYRLRENSGIDGKTIRRLKANDNMETKTLSRICEALDCRLEDIAEFVKDREEE